MKRVRVASFYTLLENEVSMMFKPKRLTFDELVERLRAFELKYGYSTIEFYRRFENGELGDDDDLMMWAGIYHLYLTSLPIRQLMQQESAAA
jgi:hypothetical protein